MKKYVRNNFSKEPNAIEAKNRETAYRAACEGIVLLENNGAMPVAPGKVALFGYGAAHTVKGGSGSGDVNERYCVSILEGMENAGYEITSRSYLDRLEMKVEEAKKNEVKDAFNAFKTKPGQNSLMGLVGILMGSNMIWVEEAITEEDLSSIEDTHTAIYVASRQAGEGKDRKIDEGENDLSPLEIANLKKLTAAFDKVILVINVGCSLNMDFLNEVPDLGAVVFFAQQGVEGGTAFADVLSGKVSPSGKLTDTWAKKYEDIPFHDEFSYLNGDLHEEYYKEGILVGYRYFDTYGVEPQYPFGYGLSYTTFSLETESVTLDKTAVTVNVKVTNIGDCAGKEVVQVYMSAPNGLLKKEAKSLMGFAKTGVLEPGASETVSVSYDMTLAASYQEFGARWILDAGNYIVRVGNSSAATEKAAVIALDELAVTEQVKNICSVVNEFELLDLPDRPEEDIKGLPVLSMKAADVATVIHDYKNPMPYHSPEVDAIMDKLSTWEKIQITVGSTMMNVDRPVNCRGSVGHSTAKLVKKGLPNVEMCDGPTGLRISKETGVSKSGKDMTSVDGVTNFRFLPESVQKAMFADPEKDRFAYQFATAWPVPIAQAQTWNTDLIHEIGLGVCAEMSEFLCTYWLAPGLNIHRNPLCGRNFEYYSEDPVLTGLCATALVSGVQNTPGNYVCMKHYACNNSEDNRIGGNVNVGERALREIYLKGFGMAVKDAGAKSIMSSYNQINGIPASNNYDTLTTVLRNEWGFDGVVMSDWMGSTVCGNPINAVKAGNDLQMPGLGVEAALTFAGLKLKYGYEQDIDRCARNVVRQILESDAVRQMNAGELDEMK